MDDIAEPDQRLLRVAIAAAERARSAGNHPFGALLADREGSVLLEAENTVVTEGDPTAHAEINLIRSAAQRFEPEIMAHYTLYASTEPCPMCAGAIYWGGVGRVVYGLSQERLYALVDGGKSFVMHCRQVLDPGSRPIEVLGPLLEDEAVAVHEGYWG